MAVPTAYEKRVLNYLNDATRKMALGDRLAKLNSDGSYTGTINMSIAEDYTQGEFSSTAAGLGFPIVRATATAASRIYADDVGADLFGSGSVPDLRVDLSRMLVTHDQTGGHIRLFGSMAQIKSHDVGWNTEQVAGQFGYLELTTDKITAAVTFGGYGITAGICGMISTSDTGASGTHGITIDTNHVLAGVAAISKMGWAGTFTDTGKTAGFYVGKYDTTNWSSAAPSGSITSWKYGLYINAAAVKEAIRVGELGAAGAAGSGVVLTATYTAAVRVYAEDGAADLGSAATIRSIMGRCLVSGNYTQQAEVFGIIGQCIVKQATVNHNTAGVVGSWEGNTTGPTITGTAWDSCHAGVLGRVGAPASTTLSATGVLAGVAAKSNIASTNLSITTGGIYAGLYVGKFATTQDFGYGIFIDAAAVTKAISVGTYASAIDTGMYLNGSTWNVGFFLDDSGDAQTASTVVRNLISRAYFTVDQTNTSCDFDAIRGHIKAASGVDFSGDTSTRACVRGYLEMAGATICGAGAFLSGIMAELWGDSDITGTGKIAGVMSRLYTAAGTTSGTTAAFMATKHFASTQNWPYGLYIDSATIDIRLGAGPCVVSGAGAPSAITATKGSIYLRTNGTTTNDRAYINTDGGTTWTALTTAA